VSHQSTNDYTILGLNNWETYNTPDNKRTTNEQQTNNKRITTTNKENKENKEYKENNISKDTEQAPKYEILKVEEENLLQNDLLEKTMEVVKETF
jgi:hypothetical protein